MTSSLSKKHVQDRRAAIVYLGRSVARGERRRVDDLAQVIGGAGFEVHEVPLLPKHKSGAPRVLRELPNVVVGRIVPEAMAWDPSSVLAALRALAPSVVVFESLRAYHPDLIDGEWVPVLDLVDRLSVSYRDRAELETRRLTRLGLRILSRTAARAERRRGPIGLVRIAAGRQDAQALVAAWIPNLATIPSQPRWLSETHDVLFVGTLRYLPNVQAIERLAAIWPRVLETRPGTSALIAGANPSRHVLGIAQAQGWTVRPDFARLDEIMQLARLSVAPLAHASGIQNKILDSAAWGLPQVVDPVVMNGLDPGFPLPIAANDDEFAKLIVLLLDDEVHRRQVARAAKDHVVAHYGAEAWSQRFAQLISQDQRPRL